MPMKTGPPRSPPAWGPQPRAAWEALKQGSPGPGGEGSWSVLGLNLPWKARLEPGFPGHLPAPTAPAQGTGPGPWQLWGPRCGRTEEG